VASKTPDNRDIRRLSAYARPCSGKIGFGDQAAVFAFVGNLIGNRPFKTHPGRAPRSAQGFCPAVLHQLVALSSAARRFPEDGFTVRVTGDDFTP
jgi:hypothetical protein